MSERLLCKISLFHSSFSYTKTKLNSGERKEFEGLRFKIKRRSVVEWVTVWHTKMCRNVQLFSTFLRANLCAFAIPNPKTHSSKVSRVRAPIINRLRTDPIV